MSVAGVGVEYAKRRDWIARYFDERADRWASLTGAEPVGRIRTTVREGRRQIQDAVLSWLPDDLSGARILDAGCGPGSFALRLAERGADVVGIDVSPALVEVARARAAGHPAGERVSVAQGDMLDFDTLGRFDWVVALDSLINYPVPELRAAVVRIAGAADRGVVFTVAPWTPMLALMHAVGSAFPRANRSPAIEPVPVRELRGWIDGAPALDGWRVASEQGVHRGFYISTALHIAREVSA
jgi:magnesium-protoporphyrin O-methyltransferase